MAKFNLEDAAKNHAGIPLNRIVDNEERYFNSSTREYDSFIKGAEYIKKTMYSEEELQEKTLLAMIAIMQEYSYINGTSIVVFHQEWFEQFKKK